MNHKKISETLDKIFEDNNDTVSILIDGSWGIGKTYTLQNWLEKKKDRFKIIYVSVFGKDSIKDIEKEIVSKILKVEISDSFKAIKSSKDIGLNAIKKIVLDKFNIDLELNNYLNDIYVDELETKEPIIICIDDIERMSEEINIKNLMGLIERISEKFNLITIANISKLIDSKIFNKYKEKVIDYELEISDLDYELLDEITRKEINTLTISQIDTIRNIFIYKNNIDLNIQDGRILYNIRIYKKYIKLLKKVYNESKKLLNTNDFLLDDTIIQTCKEVVVNYYSEDEEIDSKRKQSKNELFFIIGNIFLYENYNEEILKQHLLHNVPISKDIRVLNSIFNVSRAEISSILDKIEEHIRYQDLDYFTSQSKVISLYDALLNIKYKQTYKDELFEIAKKLTKINYLEKYEEFKSEYWEDFKFNQLIQCSKELIEFINNLNNYNYSIYQKTMFKAMKKALDENDTNTIINILKNFNKLSLKIFIPIFEFCLCNIDNGKKGPYWHIIMTLFNITDSGDVEKYLDSKINSEKDYISKIRLIGIKDMQEEYIYERRLEEEILEWEKNH